MMICDLKNETEMTHLIVNVEMLLLLASMNTEERSLHTGLLILLPRFQYICRKKMVILKKSLNFSFEALVYHLLCPSFYLSL